MREEANQWEEHLTKKKGIANPETSDRTFRFRGYVSRENQYKTVHNAIIYHP